MIDLGDIAPAFSFVVNKGLVPIAGEFDSKSFGNAYLVMGETPFSLRFVRDRSQIFVDVGSMADGWHWLNYVLEFVDNSITQQQLGAPPDPAMMARLLELHWDDVAVLFGDQQRIMRFQAFAKQKSAALVTRLFGRDWVR